MKLLFFLLCILMLHINCRNYNRERSHTKSPFCYIESSDSPMNTKCHIILRKVWRNSDFLLWGSMVQIFSNYIFFSKYDDDSIYNELYSLFSKLIFILFHHKKLGKEEIKKNLMQLIINIKNLLSISHENIKINQTGEIVEITKTN